MNEQKRAKIEMLASAADEKLMKYQMMGLQNMPKNTLEKRRAFVEYKIAEAELIEANNALEDALNS